MRVPQRPPPVSELLEKTAQRPERLGRALEITSRIEPDGRYLHWDKLRLLRPPTGLSHHEWWLATKLLRRPQMRTIPLKDRSGAPFQFALPDPAPEQLHHIDQDAGGHIQGPESITASRTRDQYVFSSLVEEAIRSSQLEGAATTRKIAREMIRASRAPRNKSEQMILNNYRAMQQIQRLRDQPLTPDLVFELHRMLTQDTLESASECGRLRKRSDKVRVEDVYGEAVHMPPPARELPRRLEEMCRFANGETPKGFVPPVVRSIILHFWLAYDHPFVDGNGRSSRGLFYWSMLRHNYWLFEFLSISTVIKQAPVKYARAFLCTETDDNDLTYFILYHLDVIRKAVVQLHRYLDHKAEELAEAQRHLRATEGLNHRQGALLAHALRHPDAQYTIESHRNSHGVVYQTARTDLLSLSDQGFLEKQKVGKTWYFYPAENLADRLGGKPNRAPTDHLLSRT